jgi:hypothetical protein
MIYDHFLAKGMPDQGGKGSISKLEVITIFVDMMSCLQSIAEQRIRQIF